MKPGEQWSLSLLKGDITHWRGDAIVNAADERLLGGGGVDGAIPLAAGPTVLDECQAILVSQGPCLTGDAVVTAAGNLRASWVVHTVGPIWGDHDPIDASTLLSSCYSSSLDLASTVGAKSVAFASISTGVYGFPRELAAPIAVSSVLEWLRNNASNSSINDVTLVCFDQGNHELVQDALNRLCQNSN
ncbi:MAG: macro domain-containing protein [Acidimicrobiales bacterium]|nr:macro domain-containing protein [Acidimicrobiales bacterium]